MTFLNIVIFFLFFTIPISIFAQILLKDKIGAKFTLYGSLTSTALLALLFSCFYWFNLPIFWQMDWSFTRILQLYWGGDFQGPVFSFAFFAVWFFLFLKIIGLKSLFFEDETRWRFFIYSDLFLFFFLIALSANHFISLLFGWEFLGIMLYLLLTFSCEDSTANQAGFIALLFDKIGSIFFLLAGGILFSIRGDLSFYDFQKISGKETLVSIFFFVATYCKMLQVGANLWITRSQSVPSFSLIIASNFFYSLPALIFLWRVGLLQIDLLKNTALFLGGVTFLLGLGLALMENIFKKWIVCLTVALWGLILMLASFGLYDLIFNSIFN